jgi:hypothetical protein
VRLAASAAHGGGGFFSMLLAQQPASTNNHRKLCTTTAAFATPQAPPTKAVFYGAGNVRKELSRRRLASARPRRQDSTHCEGFVG